MTAYLKIMPADIPFHSVTITPSVATNEHKTEWNLVAGERYQQFELASAAASSENLVFDLGSDYASKYNTVEAIIIARADKLQGLTTTRVRIDSSSDDVSYTSRLDSTSFDSATLYGPREDDFINTTTETAAFRYWKVTYFGASVFTHSKLYFGKFFTFDQSPDFVPRLIEAGESRWYSSSGAAHFIRPDEPVYQFDFVFTRLTDATIAAFINRIGRWKHIAPVFLYTTGQHQILANQRLVHAHLRSFEWRRLPGVNNLNECRMTFEEVLG